MQDTEQKQLPEATCAGELLLSRFLFIVALLSILGNGDSCSPDMHSTSCLCPAKVCRQTRVSMSCTKRNPLIRATKQGAS